MQIDLSISINDESAKAKLFSLLSDLNYVESFEEKNETSDEVKPYFEEKHTYTLEDIEAIAGQFPKDKKWLSSDLEKYFPQDLHIKVEVINNQLYIMASPEEIHQDIILDLAHLMKAYAKKHQLGKVIISPFDVVLDENNTVVPDIVFISIANNHIRDGKRANGSPDLVVEAWSKGNSKKARLEKKELYEQKGILEFWEIEPKKQKVLINVLNDNQKYEIFSEAEKKGKIKSKVLKGLELDLEDIFEEES